MILEDVAAAARFPAQAGGWRRVAGSRGVWEVGFLLLGPGFWLPGSGFWLNTDLGYRLPAPWRGFPVPCAGFLAPGLGSATLTNTRYQKY